MVDRQHHGGAFTDAVNGGKGIDTYDASAATHKVEVYLYQLAAFGDDIGFDDVTGFENAIGGSGSDVLAGNKAANTLIGGVGNVPADLRSAVELHPKHPTATTCRKPVNIRGDQRPGILTPTEEVKRF